MIFQHVQPCPWPDILKGGASYAAFRFATLGDIKDQWFDLLEQS